MGSVEKKKNIDAISRRAMKAQRASFRIEGINISEKRAEIIRQEVVSELKQSAKFELIREVNQARQELNCDLGVSHEEVIHALKDRLERTC